MSIWSEFSTFQRLSSSSGSDVVGDVTLPVPTDGGRIAGNYPVHGRLPEITSLYLVTMKASYLMFNV
jgi:hypothetical protein